MLGQGNQICHQNKRSFSNFKKNKYENKIFMWYELTSILQHIHVFKVLYARVTVMDPFVCFICYISLPYLFEVHYDATFLHHGVLLVVIHQVSQGVKPLTSTHVIFTVLLETHINTQIKV